MDHTGVKRRMEVIGGDGVHVGTVDSVEHGKIRLSRTDSGEGHHKGHYHFIDLGLVADVEGHSFVVIFRYGVVVLFGMTPLQEDQIIQSLADASLGVIHVANRKRPT